jgi:hypothetical protein
MCKKQIFKALPVVRVVDRLIVTFAPQKLKHLNIFLGKCEYVKNVILEINN